MLGSPYDFSAKTLKGETVSLSDYSGKVLLIVNTASKCGLTPQYEGLEKLHRDYASRGLVILGFPCNQFGAQEPGSTDEIGEFCSLNYGVSFTMFDKIDVNGRNSHPLYKFLKLKARGMLGTKAIKWNFTKFLVDRSGQKIKRFAPKELPANLAPSIEALL